jgi:hypothetical protein
MLHLWLIYLFLLSCAAAQTLQPIRPWPQGPSANVGLMKRDADALALRDYEIFLWGAEGMPLCYRPSFASDY